MVSHCVSRITSHCCFPGSALFNMETDLSHVNLRIHTLTNEIICCQWYTEVYIYRWRRDYQAPKGAAGVFDEALVVGSGSIFFGQLVVSIHARDNCTCERGTSWL